MSARITGNWNSRGNRSIPASTSSSVTCCVVGGSYALAAFRLVTGAVFLGLVTDAMLLGHWYLVTPALSEKPLQFATTLVLLGVLAQVLFAFTAGPSTIPQTTTVQQPSSGIATPTTTPDTHVKPANAPTYTPLSTDAISWIRILVSFIIPLVLGSLAWKLIRDRLDFAVMGRYNRLAPGTQPLRSSRNQKLHLFTARYEESDFGEQIVEVSIEENGAATITGFPVLGCAE